MQIDIDEIEPGYPPPRPPRNKKADVFRKEDFAAIDNRSREVINQTFHTQYQVTKTMRYPCILCPVGSVIELEP